MYPQFWGSREILAQSSVIRENDSSILSDFRCLVGIDKREEYDLSGVPYGVPVCSRINDGSGFFIHL